MTTSNQPTLYERLGGVYSIATVVDDFIDRVMSDPRLNANPRVDEAHHRVSPAGFKYYVTEMVCGATGGPQKYTGRTMKDSHQALMITGRLYDEATVLRVALAYERATKWHTMHPALDETLKKIQTNAAPLENLELKTQNLEL